MSFFDDASLVMIPSGYKDQKVYSVKPTDGTGDLTFSRASSATRVQSDGLIEKVRTNLVLQSEAFNTTWAVNGIVVTANSAANPLTGTTTADTITADAANNFHLINQSVTYSANENTVSVYVKANGYTWFLIDPSITNAFGYFNVTTGAVGTKGSACTTSISNVGGGWYRCSVTFTASAGAAICNFSIRDADNGGAFLGDGVSGFFIFGAQAETGVATDYIPTTTAAVSVGPVSGLPRLDYLGSTCPRLLLEPQRTNVATYSEQFDNAGWGKTQSGTGLVPVVTANNAISPDGYQNADTIVFDVGAGTTSSDISAMFQTFGGTTATYTGSFYAKTASGTAQIQVRIDGSNYDKFTITNQWQRFTLTKALTGTSNVFEMAIRRGLNEPMNATATIQLWGVQVELGAYATSYIPTLGASVTRVAETAIKTSATALIGQTEGTIFLEFQKNAGVDAANIAFTLSDGTSANLIYYNFEGPVIEFIASSSVQAIKSGGINLVAGTNKIAVYYKANDFGIYLNGVSIFTDTSGSVGAMSKFNLGSFFNDSFPVGTPINQALLFKTRLTNAQLAELTA